VSLVARIFLLNAAVLLAAGLALLVTPVTVSSPTSLREAVVVVVGLVALLVVNVLVLRRTFAPLVRLSQAMQTVEPLHPGGRVPVYGDDREVVNLTSAFNEMLDRLERERERSVRLSLAGQENERRRVAQELHDEVGQTLTAVLLQLERLGRTAPPELREELSEARETARTSLEEVRAVAQRLRPEALDDLGLRNALAALAQRLSERSGIRIVRRLDSDVAPLSREAELVVYRVAQEALTNTLRHSGATRAEVALSGHGERVVLRVSDDGRGLDGAEPGAGIQGMRERALLVGGELELSSPEGGGAEVRLELDGSDER
jgi:two-component system, NarL family, sensor histidine kinase UhpB